MDFFKNIESWIKTLKDECKERINTGGKALVLVSGASSSGKSFKSKILVEELLKDGIKAEMFSTDNFYKGISRMLVEKVNKNFYNGKLEQVDKIISVIVDVTFSSVFNKKLCEENKIKISESLDDLMDKTEKNKFLECLEIEFKRINFDEPAAVNLSKCAEFIKQLFKYPQDKLTLPAYEMTSGENNPLLEKQIVGQNFQVIIVEGIYALDLEFLKSLEDLNPIKTFINTDLKTLLIRKLDRDILSGRSTMTKSKIFDSFLTTILPGYEKYTLPGIKNADFVLNDSISDKELKVKNKTVQCKYKVSEEEIKNLKQNSDFNHIKTVIQNDYYFELEKSKSNSNNCTLRLRMEDDKFCDFSYKSPNNKTSDNLIRFTQVFDLSKEEDAFFDNNLYDFINKIKRAGYMQSAIINKSRALYDYFGVEVCLDFISEIGPVIEVRNPNLKQNVVLSKMFSSCERITVDYYTLFREIENFKRKNSNIVKVKTEAEKKFLIDAVPQDFISEKNIEQTYLDLNNPFFITKFNDFKTWLNIDAEISDFAEARVRIENNKTRSLTLKDKNNLKRKELELFIFINDANNLISNAGVKVVKKTRFLIYKDKNFEITVDLNTKNSKNKTIITSEIEYNSDLFTEEEATDFLIKTLSPYCKQIIDVTNDESYKNNKLAIFI